MDGWANLYLDPSFLVRLKTEVVRLDTVFMPLRWDPGGTISNDDSHALVIHLRSAATCSSAD